MTVAEAEKSLMNWDDLPPPGVALFAPKVTLLRYQSPIFLITPLILSLFMYGLTEQEQWPKLLKQFQAEQRRFKAEEADARAGKPRPPKKPPRRWGPVYCDMCQVMYRKEEEVGAVVVAVLLVYVHSLVNLFCFSAVHIHAVPRRSHTVPHQHTWRSRKMRITSKSGTTSVDRCPVLLYARTAIRHQPVLSVSVNAPPPGHRFFCFIALDSTSLANLTQTSRAGTSCAVSGPTDYPYQRPLRSPPPSLPLPVLLLLLLLLAVPSWRGDRQERTAGSWWRRRAKVAP